MICDQVRANPDAITIVALGPLTNIARAFQRDPELPSLVGRVVMAGGAVAVSGNYTAAAEFNMFCDPPAAQTVFRSASTKTLIPLDVTNRITLSFDLYNQLPDETTHVGKLLRKILPSAFRGYRQRFGIEGIHVHDTVTLMAVLYPELFTAQEMAGDVETMGELTTGMTVFDRRRIPAPAVQHGSGDGSREGSSDRKDHPWPEPGRGEGRGGGVTHVPSPAGRGLG